MNLFSWLKREKKQYPDGHDFWYSRIMGFLGNSNITINEESALRFLTVFACVRIISNTVGAIPLIMYKRLSGRGKERAEKHRLYKIIRMLPNPEMTAITFRSALQGHLTTWGNAYCLKEYRNDGQIKTLWPLTPNKMSVKRENGKTIYEYQTKNGVVTIPNENVLHIPSFGFDGLMGYSQIALAEKTIKTGLQMESFNQKFYKNGARPASILKHPGKLESEARKNLKDSLLEMTSGEDLFQSLVLEEGMDFTQFSMPLTDAQFLESRKFTQTQIAGELYGVPLHKVGNLDRATFSNIEEQNLGFYTDTMISWFTLWEQELFKSLLTENEQDQYFFEFKTDALLRGDIRSRYQAYAIGRQNGWLSANDIREKENDNPLPDEQGNIYTIPTNTIPADKIDDFYTNKSGGNKDAGKN